MNRIYKVIWSRVKKCYVVVSEFANNRGKISGSGGTSARTVLCALALAGSIALPLNTVYAVIPEGTGSGMSLGNGTETGSDPNNVAIGGYAKALGTVALAIGAHSNSSAQYSTALGGGSNATAQNATAIGGVAYASAKNAVAVGANAKASGEYAAAIGGDAKADKTHAIAIGSVAHAQEESSLAMGSLAKATNTYAYAIGGNAQAKGRWSIAMGTNAVAEDDASVAIGTWSNATSGQSAAVGYQAKAKALGATALGRLTNVTAVDGTAIGSSTSVTGLNGTAIGNKANVTVKNGVAIGNEANAKNENAVAIGSGSETAAAVGTTSETVNGEVHNFAGINPTSTVSVGKTGVERTITNVAAGRLSATSTDAINGSQLYAVNTEVNKGVVYAGDVKVAGATDNKFIQRLGAQTNVVGGVTDVSKLSDNNIGVVSANSVLNVKLAKELKNLTSVTTGDTVMNTDGLTINGGPKILKNGIDAGNKKITNVAAGTDNTDAVNVGQLKDAIAAGKTILKDGKNTTVEGDGSAANPYKVNVNDDLVLGKKGIDGKDGSIGVNGKDGSTVVINGKDGSIGLNGKDGNNAISIKGGEGKSGIDGKNITRLVIEEKNGDKHDVATLDDGMKYGGDTGAVIKKKLNEQVNVVGGITDVSKLTTDDNIGVISDGDSNLKVRLAKDLKGLNSVTTGDTVMNTDGLTINGGPKIVKTGIDAGGKKITNVADGTDVTDAVNVSQLSKAVAGATTKLENGKNTTVTSITNNDGSKTYKVNLNDDITLGTDPNKQISIKGSEGTIQAGKVTVNGTAGTVNNLTNKTWDPANITSGQAATEDQLKAVANGAGKYSSVSEGNNISVIKGTNAIGGVDYKVSVIDTPTFKSVTTGNTIMNNNGLTIKNGPSITETGINAGNKKITNVAAGTSDSDAVNVSQLKEIGGNIKNIDSRMNRVGAGAAALAALHPLDFDPDDKWDIAAGYGNYKDAHAASIGAFYRPNDDTLFSVGGSFGGGENMLNAGVSMKIGQGNHVSTSRVAMAKEIKDLRAELENVKGILMKVSEGKQLNSLDLDKMQLFPDIPENHWAYDYVATLAGNGIIVGYPDGKFGGDRMMTRYEMAALIYRAIQNGAVADDQMVRALKEFQPELERIRVDTISKHKDGTPDIQRVRVIKGRG